MSTDNINYAAILKITDVDLFVKQIEDLQNQKYQPISFFVVALTKPNKDELNKIGEALNKTSRPWTIKANLDNYSLDYLIDEFFSGKIIKSKTCLVIQDRVSPLFSEKLKDTVLENKDCWYFKIDGHIYFYSILCEYYNFENIEKGIMSADYADKIYRDKIEYSIT